MVFSKRLTVLAAKVAVTRFTKSHGRRDLIAPMTVPATFSSSSSPASLNISSVYSSFIISITSSTVIIPRISPLWSTTGIAIKPYFSNIWLTSSWSISTGALMIFSIIISFMRVSGVDTMICLRGTTPFSTSRSSTT